MFQIERFDILRDATGVQTGISLQFSTGQTVAVDFADIPESAGTAAEKARWLADRLNEMLVVGTRPDGSPIRHYKANVVALAETPFTVGVSIEAV